MSIVATRAPACRSPPHPHTYRGGTASTPPVPKFVALLGVAWIGSEHRCTGTAATNYVSRQ